MDSMPHDFDFPDVGGLDLDLDIDPSDFDIDLSLETDPTAVRYQKPRLGKTQTAIYKNALQLAQDIDLHEGFRAFVLVPGSFVFGDIIEALSYLDKWRVDKLTIHTLAMSQNSIDSLANVIEMDDPSQLHIIMSDYWYAHERGSRTGLLWELYDKCDIGDGFKIAFCRTHAKIATIMTQAGHKITIHGSANFRSCGVMEQFVIEHDPDLYDFIETYHDGILDLYDTVNHGCKDHAQDRLPRRRDQGGPEKIGGWECSESTQRQRRRTRAAAARRPTPQPRSAAARKRRRIRLTTSTRTGTRSRP